MYPILSVGASYGEVGSGVLVDCMLLLVCFMYPFEVAMVGGRCFMRSTVSLGHVANDTLLMARRRFLRKGRNSVAWYH